MLLPQRHFGYQLHEEVFRVKTHPTPRRGKGRKMGEGREGRARGYGPISYEKCAKSHVRQCGGQTFFYACGGLSSIPEQLCALPLLFLLLHHCCHAIHIVMKCDIVAFPWVESIAWNWTNLPQLYMTMRRHYETCSSAPAQKLRA